MEIFHKVISSVETSISQMFPNPAFESTSFNVSSYTESTIDIKVYGETGSLLRSEQRNLTTGNNKVTIDLASFPSGVYLIQTSNAGEINTERIIKN